MARKTEYVVRRRKGKPILVDLQIIRWRKSRKRQQEAAAKIALDARKSIIGEDLLPEAPELTISNIFASEDDYA